ncbi:MULTISPECIES: Rieske 2Fe-2S domain-containing protein [Cycloclasticus]|jgi:benzoate/toluate 1,2-dioxygenase subunit alpha|uniref:Ring hydroxylating dioxygenase subunit alpha/Rieske (2Fe-2S) protein n=1 Tax=Cycloclasticus pugetii TaxID=34068 RepID=A0AB33Z599_9GAMM|nr:MULTISPECIES: aromatic ring-hydroxylating dioxygenase subunit alpha [Cycloclasticus]AFT66539.1 Ring hydroxylating dioxygenase, alpha subunit: Rieske (2Fe-2S) region protein [Cycloclasticus sp. P1]ATI03887.1 benzoate 1,2-dioxygenase large subunit [Cycloclasticus sp. PY97N]EPD14322.1 ring hydroxylating dioxygenase subunit alpha/Rieske (2Fe-2S) protein [Cycloclasticus pugetii]
MGKQNKIDFGSYLIEDKEQGIYRADRRVFTDEEIFDMEMKTIFEKNWVYLCHESQIKNPNDFFTTYMGRQPVIITRDKDGEIHGFINACSHRGAQLVNTACGNKRKMVCPFHMWTYDMKGKLLDCGEHKNSVGYSESFDKDNLGLQTIGDIESYRGFVFGVLDDNACSLKEFLGEATHSIDLLVDQAEGGLEVLPGITTYTYNGNWKLQAENGVDGYHLEAIHGNYVMTLANRKKIQAENDAVKAADVGAMSTGSTGELPGGYYHFGNGHVMLWGKFPSAQDRPLYVGGQMPALREKFGEARAEFMAGFLRNTCIYPNVFLMDQMSTQIRHFRPISVDKTEVTTYCVAPVGESDEARERRIRQYEDFFNATGMATPDDLTAFNNSQIGFMGEKQRWSDMCRGAMNTVEGPEKVAKTVGINPVESGTNLEDEGIMVAQHKRWAEMMAEGQAEES